MLGATRAFLLSRWLAPFVLAVGALGVLVGAAGPRLVSDVRAGTATPRTPAAAKAPSPAMPSALPEAPTGPVVLEPVTIKPGRHPLDAFSLDDLRQLALAPPRSLGSITVGRPTRGRLLNGVELRSGPGVRVMMDDHGFGTASTVRFILDAAAEMQERFPGAPDVAVGDISRERGGYLRPHRSHQLGLDVDVGYFYDPPARWYTRATEKNLDRTLTWALLKALIAQGGVEYVFMDRSVQRLLREHATASGEDPAWLDEIFERSDKKDTLFRHTWGHLTHFHVRFYDPVAEESGRRLEKHLRRAGKI